MVSCCDDTETTSALKQLLLITANLFMSMLTWLHLIISADLSAARCCSTTSWRWSTGYFEKHSDSCLAFIPQSKSLRLWSVMWPAECNALLPHVWWTDNCIKDQWDVDFIHILIFILYIYYARHMINKETDQLPVTQFFSHLSSLHITYSVVLQKNILVIYLYL